VYHVEVALPESLRLLDNEDLTVYAHGCVPETLFALNNTSISGQITVLYFFVLAGGTSATAASAVSIRKVKVS
jgi:hypothetical protein